MRAACLLLLSAAALAAPAPRNVRVSGKQFVLTATNKPIILNGPNVVVKGPPYLPKVTGDTVCNDEVNAACRAAGTCTSCYTFNHADIAHMKKLGWNAIRLGVVWAGAQPRDEDALDPVFVERLHAVLNLTDAAGIHVMLDNHGDMVGTAGCGNGVPMWVQKKASPELIGKPLETGFPYDLIPELQIKKLAGYDKCGSNATKWAQHAGDPNYNILNECCGAMNSPNPGALGFTKVSQATMDYVMRNDEGRKDFVRFWRLMAEAVVDHPSAYAAELMNEPMSIWRKELYDTWKACAVAINAVIPDMSVAVTETGEDPYLPAWVAGIIGESIDISRETLDWMKASNTLFYAVHGYQGTPEGIIRNARMASNDWTMPIFLTEYMGCANYKAFRDAGISHTYWHYSAYCNTGPAFGNRKVPEDTFGACILGWSGGNSSAMTDKACP